MQEEKATRVMPSRGCHTKPAEAVAPAVAVAALRVPAGADVHVAARSEIPTHIRALTKV